MLTGPHQPQAVVVDPIGNLTAVSGIAEARMMVVRLIDYLKTRGSTALITSLTAGESLSEEFTDMAVSSIVDTWLLVKSIENSGERNRGMYVLKSRGMAHSNQIREFLITKDGVQLIETYVGSSGVLTGSARLAQQAQENAAVRVREEEAERRKKELDRKRRA